MRPLHCDSSIGGGGGSVRSAVSSILFLSFRLMRISLIKVSGPPWAVRGRRNDSAVVYNNDDRKNKNENERSPGGFMCCVVCVCRTGFDIALR
jgi:hypothetical protein